MLWGVFLSLSALFLLLFAYPYAIYPFLVRRLPRKPVNKLPINFSMSLLFCAYNEAQSLPAKIQNLTNLKERYESLEILVFDDGSTDGTTELLNAASEILTVVQGEGRSGKACGMKQLARMAKGDILIFSDANVLLAEDGPEKLLPYYGDSDVGGVCGSLVYSAEEGAATAEVGSIYWRLDEKLKSLESDTGSVMGADGSIFSIRRDLYPDFPDSVLDDFTVSMHVVFAGQRLVKAPDVLAFENSVSDRYDELRRKIRIGARSYHTHLHLAPKLSAMSGIDRFKYVSRKYLRWFGGTSLTLSFIFAIAAIYAVAPMLALAATLVSVSLALLLSVAGSGTAAKVGDAILAVFATQYGVFKGMSGQTVSTWAPAKSR